MQNFFETLTGNYVLNVAVLSWFAAQITKTILYAIQYKTFNPERLFGAGGMPSAHSATVCGMTIALARSVGFTSPIFAVAAVLAMITMYDAMGVRRQAGMHAKMLNILLRKEQEKRNLAKEAFASIGEELKLKKNRYKEYLGHTPLQVLVGALLGIVIALAVPMN